MVATLDIPQMDTLDSQKISSSLDFRVFPGQITVKMPLLIKQGRTPISIYELARKRLVIREIYRNVTQNPHQYPESFRQEIRKKYDLLWNKYYDTGDMWLRQSASQGGKGKLVLYNAEVLEFLKRNLNPESRLTDRGPLALDMELEGAYDSFTGSNVLELTKAEMNIFFGRLNTRQEAKESPFWKLVLGDIRNDYIDAVFSDGEERFRYQHAMGTYVLPPENVSTGVLFFVTSLEGRSNASGVAYMGCKSGRIVGVAPEASTIRKPAALEQMV